MQARVMKEGVHQRLPTSGVELRVSQILRVEPFLAKIRVLQEWSKGNMSDFLDVRYAFSDRHGSLAACMGVRNGS